MPDIKTVRVSMVTTRVLEPVAIVLLSELTVEFININLWICWQAIVSYTIYKYFLNFSFADTDFLNCN